MKRMDACHESHGDVVARTIVPGTQTQTTGLTFAQKEEFHTILNQVVEAINFRYVDEARLRVEELRRLIDQC